MRHATGSAHWAVWRVRQLQWLSKMQVHQAESDRGKVSDLRHWRYCGTQGAAREFLLRLHELSEVRFHFESEADSADVPGMRQPLPAGEVAEVRCLPGMSEQREANCGGGKTGQGAWQEGPGRKAGSL